ncbi:MAG: hypothetical protein H8D23_23605 [Candidatus Brocadiales bacterium]|nr:hypothetical protein [Candidatus Brocadiales bacterium]
MAKKKTDTKMTFQYWAEIYEIKPSVLSGVKAAEDITNTSRLTEDEFKSMIDGWLGKEVKGGVNNG